MSELNQDGLEPGKPVTFEQIAEANHKRAKKAKVKPVKPSPKKDK